MNGEIMFRGKQIDNTEWVYGWFFVKRQQTDNEVCLAYITDGIDVFQVDLKTVSQYTGINDVDGEEIYEGMIVYQGTVTYGSPDIDVVGEVKFYDGSWWIDSGEEAVMLFNENCENKIQCIKLKKY